MNGENLEDRTGASDAQAALDAQVASGAQMALYKLTALEAIVEYFRDNSARPEFKGGEQALQEIIGMRNDLKTLALTGGVRPPRLQGILQAVKEAYPGQEVRQSWATIEEMHKAISSGSNGNVADYLAIREREDPEGNLALIIGMAYAPDPDKNKQILWNFMNCESSYVASILEKSSYGAGYREGFLEGLRLRLEGERQ